MSEPPSPGEEAAARPRLLAAGGLLSMTFDLQVPEGSRRETFEYRGNGIGAEEVTLRIRLADRTAGGILVWAIALGVVVLGWWLRRAAAGVRLVWAFATIVLPLALMGIVPLLWQFVLDGILFGGLGTAACWALLSCERCCRDCCRNWCRNCCSRLRGAWRDGRGKSVFPLRTFLVGAISVALAGGLPAEEQSDIREGGPAAPFVIVPYRSIEELSAADRVWIPQETYKRLWSAAHPEQALPRTPFPSGIAEATYVARIVEIDGETQLSLRARWVVVVDPDAPAEVTLPIEHFSLDEILLDGKPAAVKPDESGGTQVVIPAENRGGRGDAPGETKHRVPGRSALLTPRSLHAPPAPPRRHVIDARLHLPVETARNFGQFQLSLRPVGSGLLSFELPESEETLRVRVNGATGTYRLLATEETSLIEIPIDRAERITVAWQPETGRADRENIVHLETRLSALFSDAGLTLDHSFRAQVRQGTIEDLAFDFPEGVSIRRISGDDVGGWERDHEENRLRIYFRRSITAEGAGGTGDGPRSPGRSAPTGETRFEISLFRELEIGEEPQTLSIPSLAPRDVTRETGRIGLFAADHFHLRAGDVHGVQQIDVRSFEEPGNGERQSGEPAASPGSQPSLAGPPVLAYRFSSRPIDLEALLSRREAETRAVIEHGVHVGRRKMLIASRIELTLGGAPRRQVDIALPEGYLVVDVVCKEAADWYPTSSGEGRRLTIELDQPRVGRIEIGLEGHVMKEPEADPVTVRVPRLIGSGRETSSLGIWLEEEYRSTISSAGNWRPVPADQLPPRVKSLRPGGAQFGFASSVADPGPIELRVIRALPELRAAAVTLIAVSDATVDYGLTLRWKITSAAADHFIFTTPEWLGRLEITGPGIRQVRSAARGDGRRRWKVSLVDPVREEYLLTAAATVAAPSGQIVDTPVIEFVQEAEEPGIEGEEEPGRLLDLQRQFAILVNLSGQQLAPVDAAQHAPATVEEIPIEVHRELVQQAMEFVRVDLETVPQWRQQRMETLTGTQAVVVTADLTSVLEQDGSWRTRAVYGVRNRGRQFLALDLPQGARILSVFVRGEASRTIRPGRPRGGEVPRTGEDTEQTDSPGSRPSAPGAPGGVAATRSGSTSNPARHLIALPQTSAADLSFDVELIVEGRLPRPLPKRFAAAGATIALPVPQVVSQQESEEFGLPVAQTLWSVHFPDDFEVRVVSGAGRTNLTAHAEDAWLVLQMQSLERLRSDVAEMERIATGKGVSLSQRAQAVSNLKQLESRLEQNQGLVQPSDRPTEPGQQMHGFIIGENRKLAEQTRQAISEAQARQTSAPESLRQSSFANGRSFILSNNGIIMSNSGVGVQERGESIDGLNFFGTGDARRPRDGDEISLESLDRSRLRAQLDGQAPLLLGKERAVASPGMGMGGGLGTWHMERADEPAQRGTTPGTAPGTGGRGRDAADVPPARQSTSFNGGLSIAMEMPVTGRHLSFSKAGGNPELTLTFRHQETWSLTLGAAWCLFVLAAGGWLLYRGEGTITSRLLTAFALVSIPVGLSGLFLLPSDLRWAFFALFCLGGLTWALKAPQASPALNRRDGA